MTRTDDAPPLEPLDLARRLEQEVLDRLEPLWNPLADVEFDLGPDEGLD